MHLVAVHLHLVAVHLHLVTVLQSDAVFFESVCGIIATTMQQNIYRTNIWRAICVFNKHIFCQWAVSGWLVQWWHVMSCTPSDAQSLKKKKNAQSFFHTRAQSRDKDRHFLKYFRGRHYIVFKRSVMAVGVFQVPLCTAWYPSPSCWHAICSNAAEFNWN